MKLKAIAQALQLELVGDGEIGISTVSSMQSATVASIVFVEDEKALPETLRSGAGAIVAGEFARGATGKAMLISSQPKLAFSRLLRYWAPGLQRKRLFIPALSWVRARSSARMWRLVRMPC